MMKHTLLLCLMTLTCLGQPRQDEPLPYIAKSPTSELSKGVTGWSKSIDGQWSSEKNLIPFRTLSRRESAGLHRSHKLGLDNMPVLQMFPVVYKTDTLVCLVKHMRVGEYDYQMIEKSWKSYNRAHYFLFTTDQLDKLKNVASDKTTVIKIDLLDNGNLNYVSPGKTSAALNKTLRVNENCNRQLVLTAKTYNRRLEAKGEATHQTKLIQFQIHSQHNTADDLQGVVSDFSPTGKSHYGTPELLDHLYYECEVQQFESLLSIDGDFKIIK